MSEHTNEMGSEQKNTGNENSLCFLFRKKNREDETLIATAICVMCVRCVIARFFGSFASV